MNNLSTSQKAPYAKLAGLLLLFFIISNSVFAHPVQGELDRLSKTDVAFLYLQLGYKHILPLGLDHILFVLSLFLLNPRLKTVVWQATAFTVAHTVTLGLAMYHVINPPSNFVEPLIALSIMFVALENIFSNRLRPSRIGIIFLFGLVHGLGFASALGELGLPQNAYFSSLIMFNVGVELGQLTVILGAFFLVGLWFGKKTYYRKLIVIPASIMICFIAGYWTVERIFGT